MTSINEYVLMLIYQKDKEKAGEGREDTYFYQEN